MAGYAGDEEEQRTAAGSVAFERFVFDPLARRLYREGRRVALPPKALQTLAILIESAGAVVFKAELRERLWPLGFIAAGNLTQNIYRVRKALDAPGGGRRFIETVPRRGYRFAVPVHALKKRPRGDAAGRLH